MALQCSSWSDLPHLILELIFNCTKDPIDIVRCGAACKSWLPTALKVYPKFLRLCLILTGKGLDISRPLFNLLTKETRMIQVPEAKEKRVCSVSNTWLFIADTKFPGRLQLLNLLSGTQIDLPPIKSPAIYDDVDIRPLYCKLLLSKCPLNSDCTLFLLQQSFRGPPFERRPGSISSWKPGQEKWSNLKTEFEEIHDAILYEEKLYATVFDIITHSYLLVTYNYQLEIEAKFSIPETTSLDDNYISIRYFLVKSHNIGCLLMIGYDTADKSCNILEFDPCTKQFREVDDFGGFAFFLSQYSHIFAEAVNLETWFKANCVYTFSCMHMAFSVFNLETRDFKYVASPFFSRDENYYGNFWVNLDV